MHAEVTDVPPYIRSPQPGSVAPKATASIIEKHTFQVVSQKASVSHLTQRRRRAFSGARLCFAQR